MGRGLLRPHAAKHLEGVGGNAADAVVGAAHDEPGAAGNGAEFADDEMVSKFRPVKQDIVSFEGSGIYGVIIVGVFSHGDVGRRDYIFNIARGFVLIGKNYVGIWNSIHMHTLLTDLCVSSPPKKFWPSDAIARIWRNIRIQ